MSAPEQRPPQWESVYSTNSEADAYIVAGKLENEGITARVHKEPAGSAYGITVGLLGKVDVLVRSEDVERSTAILEDEEGDDLADYEDDE